MSHGLMHPGEKVPVSGVYRVRHQLHRGEHFVTALKRERFPACRTCGNDVTFELVEGADYVMEERDFRGVFLAS